MRVPSILCLLLVVGVAGCDSVPRSLGLVRDAPDEFSVTTRAPLIIPPPDTGLPEPRPGLPRPMELSQRKQAEEAIVPEIALEGTSSAPAAAAATTTGPSAGQQALLRASGPGAPANIRRALADDPPDTGPPRPMTDRLLFWQDPPAPGTVVDPVREAQRLRANAALGRNVKTGDTPIVQPHRKSPLEGLF